MQAFNTSSRLCLSLLLFFAILILTFEQNHRWNLRVPSLTQPIIPASYTAYVPTSDTTKDIDLLLTPSRLRLSYNHIP